MRIMTAVLVVLLCMTIIVWTNSSKVVANASAPIPSMTPMNRNDNEPPTPKYKTVNLSCSTGVIYTMVKNNSSMVIPAAAKISVQGVQGSCSQSANGPLAKGASIKLLGCPEKVTTCKAFAKWELPTP